jgi:prepilin-type N-terminal cleavage/methylation domain-containing protein
MPLRQTGFTLIEILTVLVIAGLLAALAAPPLLRLIGSTERSSQRGLLAGEITSLAYRAWLEGKPHTLGGDAKAATAYALHLAAGWRVEFAKPISYAFNGICSGGTLSIFGPEGYREDWRLAGPRCDQLLPVKD